MRCDAMRKVEPLGAAPADQVQMGDPEPHAVEIGERHLVQEARPPGGGALLRGQSDAGHQQPVAQMRPAHPETARVSDHDRHAAISSTPGMSTSANTSPVKSGLLGFTSSPRARYRSCGEP